MLKLERLEISGFKSFVDPVTMGFAGGLTAIVGPNGCGKSNISDAVTWVLGEQSAKTLRGSTMEDVIFNGTEARKPVDMAEVEMVLSTDPSSPHAEDGKITIARRVFRSGESQYRLNGKTVRLKDIRDLLMDTGLGLRAYSVIEQGRIGMILSGKPQERRKLLEEAAGITRYKARKRIAEIKLEEATENLLRLDDIVSEVERSLRSLKRQMGAARRYQEKLAEQRDLVSRVLHARWRRVGERLAEVAEALAAARAREAELAAALATAEAELTRKRESVEILAEEVAAEHERRARLAAVIEGRQELIKGSRRALEDLGERLQGGGAQAERRRADSEERRGRLAELEAQRQELEAHHEQATGDASDDQRRIGEVEALVAETGARLDSLRSRLLSSLAEVTDLRNRLRREEVENEKAAMQQSRLVAELERRGQLVTETDGAVAEARKQVEQMATAVIEGEERADTLQGKLVERRQRLDAQLEELQRLEREIDTLGERRQILKELSKAQSERRDEVARLVVDSGLEEAAFLGNLWKVPAGWEESLDFFLGDLADAIVVPPDVDSA
ncbi:MAG TPA: AAA family ATPase, partial [Thermoanaerobaculia bacterium]|nr:AAA family ATPase [Thermoanaerobaculia bacterium]